MGFSLNGIWHANETWKRTEDGHFVRDLSHFRSSLTQDIGAKHPIEQGRYHLYVSGACPWAHRVLIVRHLLGLETFLPVSSVDPLMLEDGWTFSDRNPDHCLGKTKLHDVYITADPNYTGRVTVPILFDAMSQTIVNNESSELIRMLNAVGPRTRNLELDLYPEHLAERIDRWNERIYFDLNNGVYQCGFATTQTAYGEALKRVFSVLDTLEAHLQDRAYLVGQTMTEADIRLFTTLIRFDPVYHGHFKCNLRKLSEYPELVKYVRRIFAFDGIATTCDLQTIKAHYYGSHLTINPTGIIPEGPLQWP